MGTAMLHPNLLLQAVGPSESLREGTGENPNIWSNSHDAKVKLRMMPSEVDGRWHPWISAGLAQGEREPGWAMPAGFNVISLKR